MTNKKENSLKEKLIELIDKFPPKCEVYLRNDENVYSIDRGKGTVVGYQFYHKKIILLVACKGKITSATPEETIKAKDVYAFECDGIVISSLTPGINTGKKIRVFLQDAGEIKNLKDGSTKGYYNIASIITSNGVNVREDELENFDFSFVSSDKIYKVKGKNAEFSYDLNPDSEL